MLVMMMMAFDDRCMDGFDGIYKRNNDFDNYDNVADNTDEVQ